MTTYRTARGTLILYFLLLVFTTVVVGPVVMAQLPGLYAFRLVVAVFAATWILALLSAWYIYLSTPFEITYRSGEPIVFRAMLKRTVVEPKAITSITAGPFSPTIRLAHAGGTINLLGQMDGFHELLARLKAENSAVIVRGL
ncbi:MAG: hypothetical protein RDU83_02105 [bacterium]|nr:hypothetical protein [bacterium]